MSWAPCHTCSASGRPLVLFSPSSSLRFSQFCTAAFTSFTFTSSAVAACYSGSSEHWPRLGEGCRTVARRCHHGGVRQCHFDYAACLVGLLPDKYGVEWPRVDLCKVFRASHVTHLSPTTSVHLAATQLPLSTEDTTKGTTGQQLYRRRVFLWVSDRRKLHSVDVMLDLIHSVSKSMWI